MKSLWARANGGNSREFKLRGQAITCCRCRNAKAWAVGKESAILVGWQVESYPDRCTCPGCIGVKRERAYNPTELRRELTHFHGVAHDPRPKYHNRPWRAVIYVGGGRNKFVGLYATDLEAALAHDKALRDTRCSTSPASIFLHPARRCVGKSALEMQNCTRTEAVQRPSRVVQRAVKVRGVRSLAKFLALSYSQLAQLLAKYVGHVYTRAALCNWAKPERVRRVPDGYYETYWMPEHVEAAFKQIIKDFVAWATHGKWRALVSEEHRWTVKVVRV
jgi:hypothetical protein